MIFEIFNVLFLIKNTKVKKFKIFLLKLLYIIKIKIIFNLFSSIMIYIILSSIKSNNTRNSLFLRITDNWLILGFTLAMKRNNMTNNCQLLIKKMKKRNEVKNAI